VSASSAHYLDAAAAFPGLNREFSLTLATGLPAGVDLPAVGASARPRRQGLRLAIPVTGRLQGRRHARAAAHRRRIHGVS
jgi:hypothetical protein